MQPYFLPYLGYWQLFFAVDRFVILDDVNYINRGWINRNRIPISGESHWLTIPLEKASQNCLINEIEIRNDEKWRRKMSRTIQAVYGRRKHFADGEPLFDGIMQIEEKNLASFLVASIRAVCDYLEIPGRLLRSSEVELKGNQGTGQERILKLCRALEADVYLNLPGGADLYYKEDFARWGIELGFLETKWDDIDLVGGGDSLGYSIIDLVMHNPKGRIREALEKRDFGLATV